MDSKKNTMVRVDQELYDEAAELAKAETPRKRTITDMVNVLIAEAIAARKKKKAKA